MVLLEIIGAVVFLVIVSVGMYQIYRHEMRKAAVPVDDECKPTTKRRRH